MSADCLAVAALGGADVSDNPLASQIPSAWAVYVPIAVGAARNILAALGGMGFAWAKGVTGDQITMGVSLAMIVAAAMLSAWQKIKAARALSVAAANPPGLTAPKLPA